MSDLTVAGVHVALEESPGSMDRLPGNAWAVSWSLITLPTDSATENRPPTDFDRYGKGEKVG